MSALPASVLDPFLEKFILGVFFGGFQLLHIYVRRPFYGLEAFIKLVVLTTSFWSAS
jgi:hypothetical protein